MVKNDPRITRAWCMYDWANSVYSLVITSTIFPIYYSKMAVNAQGGDRVVFLGWELSNSVIFAYVLSASFLLAALLSPFLSSLADVGGQKRRFMAFFAYMGAISCAMLFFFEKGMVHYPIFFFSLATVGYSGSLVFYNAYLPEIATEDQYDRLSARGYALGYIGSVLLLVLNLLMILQPAWFGMSPGSSLPSRLSFLLVGLWWMGFGWYSLRGLPANVYNRPWPGRWLFSGLRELRLVWSHIRGLGHLRRYLLAFFFYSMGVQTVMYMAPIYGEKELRLPSEALIGTILILQLVAIGGAWAFARMSERWGNVPALATMLLVWIGVCVGGYFVYTQWEFYALAATVGVVMGGIQALSRSTYSKLIPPQTKDHASFFSFYDLVEKLSIVGGTFAYGYIEYFTGSMRNSIFALAAFFVFGLLVLLRVKVRGGRG
ncbi:MAG: MFS transporter [Cytophagales bacterium]|nr:MFS transporter [Cytophagales bacterium]